MCGGRGRFEGSLRGNDGAGRIWRRSDGVPWGMTKERPGDGEEMKTEVTIMDKEYRERTRVEEHEAVPRKVYISKDDFGNARVHGGMPRMQVGAEGDDETGAHRTLQDEGGKRSWRGRRRRREQRREWGNMWSRRWWKKRK